MDQFFSRHRSILIGDDVYIWGGYRTSALVHDSPEKRRLLSSVGVFNVLSAAFVKRPTTGTPPNRAAMIYGSCCIGDDIYYFGGWCGGDFFNNDLSVLNITSNKWSQIPCNNGPMKKSGCGMIPFTINGENYILIIGGYGPLPNNPPSHAQYTPSPFNPSQCYTNEIHIMCVSTTPGIWTVPVRAGSVFPPSRNFSINTLPGNRAIVFGAECVNKRYKDYCSNDVFIVSYTNDRANFQKIDHSATNVPWPEGKWGHSSVVISSVSGNGEEKHYLLVLGGFDGWLMDITSGNNQWKQITLPETVSKRNYHSMSCYNMSDHCKWLIVSGGVGILSPNRLMIVELVFSPTDDNWTVTNVLNEEDVKNTTNYTKLVSDRLSVRRARREGEEQVQILKQQLKQREQEVTMMVSELSLVQRRLEDERRAHDITRQLNDEAIRQKDGQLQVKDRQLREKDVVIQQRNEALQQKDEQIQRKDEGIRRNREAIRHKEELIQQRQAEITDLRDQLENRPWVLQREEVELTNTVIGDGAYGEVWVAIFRGTRVAAKCLHQLIVSDYNRRVFTREMEISAQIHHPNIVQFIGATRVDNPILLYELMATSLHKQLEIGKPLTCPQVVGIASDICTALCYLHQWRPQPILHRDVSSPNVLMEPLPNDRWRAKLSDFGSANLQLHIKTVIPGNPAYAAPEALIPQHHTPAMDVYSFGVLLTEITLHRVPEMDSNMRYRRAQDIDWPAMKEIVLKCMNNDRSQRLTSMEILNALQLEHYTTHDLD